MRLEFLDEETGELAALLAGADRQPVIPGDVRQPGIEGSMAIGNPQLTQL